MERDLKDIFAQNVQKSVKDTRDKMSVVRFQSADLLYHCEPIDSVDYNEKPAYILNENGEQVQNMTDEELALSKQNWKIDCRITAEANLKQIKLDSDSTGIFTLPDLNSFVVISYLDEENYWISLKSKTGKIIFKTDGGDLNMSFSEFAEANDKLIEFSKTDNFTVLTNTPNVSFSVSNNIELRNGSNVISVAPAPIVISAQNNNGRIGIDAKELVGIQAKSVNMSGSSGEIISLQQGLIAIGNNTSSLVELMATAPEKSITEILFNILTVLVSLDSNPPPGTNVPFIKKILTDILAYSKDVVSVFAKTK